MLKSAVRDTLLGVMIAIFALAALVAALVVAARLPTGDRADVTQRAAPPFATDDEVQPDVESQRYPPLAVPELLPQSDHQLKPDEPVIGVQVNGTYRAYAVSAFSAIESHVVNDLVDSRPVTVSFCPRTECVRVFTGPVGTRLSLAVGGWLNRAGAEQMLLRVDRRLFRQTTGESVSGGQPLPYAALDYEMTTWGEWRQKHPDTQLYSGGAVASY